MPPTIILLERRFILHKRFWRNPSYRRTFVPIDITRLISGAWEGNRPEDAQQGAVVVPLQMDGSVEGPPSFRPMPDQQSDCIGVFDVSFLAPDQVRVTLREEECARKIGPPYRPTRQIALLRPWTPVRVLLNGRGASHSGQYYLVQEYHLALCAGPAHERLAPPRLVDLQADLF